VALGVGITAFAQSILGGIGLAIAGLPFVPVLTALMFMCCIAQLGPGLVLVPAVFWLYWSDSTGWGTFLLVWTDHRRHHGQLPASAPDRKGRRPSPCC
jgi:predicted PurR-regulated permease PerM